nr:hypothetical protein [Pseudoclavibacter sp. RFBB5]
MSWTVPGSVLEVEGGFDAAVCAAVDKRLQVAELGLPGKGRVFVEAQDSAEVGAHLLQSVAGGSGDGLEFGFGLFVEVRDAEGGGAGLHVDDVHAVGDDVVHFAGDTGAFFGAHAAFLFDIDSALRMHEFAL